MAWKMGVHVVNGRDGAAELKKRGLALPEGRVGVLDLGRMIEGWLPEPPARSPLGVEGLEALLGASGAGARGVMGRLRRSLHDGKAYMQWKEIALVFVVNGALERDAERGLVLGGGEGAGWSLVPLLGRGLEPIEPEGRGWWWAPQLG